MDKAALFEAVKTLASTRFHPRDSPYPFRQAISQYDSLLQEAKKLYPERADVQAMGIYGVGNPHKHEFGDAINRLKIALESDKPSKPLSHSKFGIPDSMAFSVQISEIDEQDLTSCLFMDLDNFKAVNDQHNHSVGDAVIKEAIRIAELAVNGKGKVFHRSGDEILVLLPNFDAEEACAAADRIRRVIETYDFPVIGQGFVTATIGVATSSDSCTLDRLEATADGVAMQAKRLGKNQVAHCSGHAITQRINASTRIEPNDAQEGARTELEASAKRIEFLSLLLGRCDALYFLLDNRRWGDNDNAGIAIAKSEIQYHEADIYNTFRDRLGSDEVDDYFQKLGSIPDDLLAQAVRINAHRNKLHALLQSERAQRQEIGLIIARQKQETLKRIEAK
jgi:diguanylate cyclase (GGDEF)-like protein